VERTTQADGHRGDYLTRCMVHLYQLGWSLNEIAKEYGFSDQGVRYRLQKAGIARRSRSEGNRLAWQARVQLRSPNWRGGRSRTAGGYVLVYKPEHPDAVGNGYVMEHRLVMEAMLGRLLAPHEIVHHINGKRDDNRPENLQLVQSLPEHMALHRARGGP